MASDTSIKFYGLWYLATKTVQASIAGYDCGDYTVAADGTITVPFQSDAGQLLTPAFLATLDGSGDEQATQIKYYLDDVLTTVTVSVVIGLGYTSQGQTLRPALGPDLGLRVTNALGKVRRSHEYAVLMHNAVAISFGTDFSDLDPVHLTSNNDGETTLPVYPFYTGVYRGVLTDEYSYDSMLAWEVTRPWPATVCAVSSFLVASED